MKASFSKPVSLFVLSALIITTLTKKVRSQDLPMDEDKHGPTMEKMPNDNMEEVGAKDDAPSMPQPQLPEDEHKYGPAPQTEHLAPGLDISVDKLPKNERKIGAGKPNRPQGPGDNSGISKGDKRYCRNGRKFSAFLGRCVEHAHSSGTAGM